MKSFLARSTLVAGLFLSASGAMAAPARFQEILHDHATRGAPPPAVAIEQLESVAPGRDATAEQLGLYYGALGLHAAAGGPGGLADSALEQLRALARGGDCPTCETRIALIEGQVAARGRERDKTALVLAQLEAQPPVVPELLMEAHLLRARAMEMAGEFTAATEAAVRAGELAARLDRPGDELRAINELVLANIGRNDLDRALELAVDGYARAEGIGHRVAMIHLRGNQSVVHSRRNQPEQQHAALMDVLRLTRGQPGLDRVEMITLINLSEYYGSRQQHREALDYANQAEQAARGQNEPASQAVAILNVGMALAQLGKTGQGIRRLHEAVELAEAAGSKGYLFQIQLSLATVYEQAGRLREALDTVRTATALQEEMTREQREEAVLELQEKYSAERKSREIERLSLENARKQAEQRMWTAAALALLLAAVLLVQWLRRVRRRNHTLETDNAVLSEQTSVDPLTGAFNRRHCQRLMGQHEMVLQGRSRGRGSQACVGLVLLDVDFFKTVNDRHGHAAGDAVLVSVAERLQALVREQDAVVRWGGEEFLLVLPATSAEGLQVLVGRVLDAVGSRPVEVGKLSVPVTVSAGCVAWPTFPGQHWEDALHMADLALYRSKSTGRNRAVCVMDLAADAELDRVRSDLAAAQEAGDVRLATVAGPERAPAPRRPPAAGPVPA